MSSDEGFDSRWIGAVIRRPLWHFHRQLYRRYGIVLAPGQFNDLVRALQDGRAQPVLRKKGGKAVYSHRLRGSKRLIYVLAWRGLVFTAWPPKAKLNEIRRAMRVLSNQHAATAENDLEPSRAD